MRDRLRLDRLRKRFSKNMQQIYKRTPMLKCDFNKVALLCNLIEITFWHGCSSVNLLHIFRTLFPKNTCHFWRAVYAKRPDTEEYHLVLEPQYRGNIGIFHIIQYHAAEVLDQLFMESQNRSVYLRNQLVAVH